jgi:hypothetical protein
VLLRDITPELARGFCLNRPGGALTAEVAQDGRAARAGVQSEDIVIEHNRKPILNRRNTIKFDIHITRIWQSEVRIGLSIRWLEALCLVG